MKKLFSGAVFSMLPLCSTGCVEVLDDKAGPALYIDYIEENPSSLKFDLYSKGAESAAYLLVPGLLPEDGLTAEKILSQGQECSTGKATVSAERLTPCQEHTIYYAAKTSFGVYSMTSATAFTSAFRFNLYTEQTSTHGTVTIIPDADEFEYLARLSKRSEGSEERNDVRLHEILMEELQKEAEEEGVEFSTYLNRFIYKGENVLEIDTKENRGKNLYVYGIRKDPSGAEIPQRITRIYRAL